MCAIRYFFHLRIDRELHVDDVGVELTDLDSAYLEAFQAAQDMWGELLADRCDPLERSFEIVDSDGRLLLIVPFREVLERARKPMGRIPDQVRSAQVLLERTRTLANSLREEISNAQQMIATAQRSMRQTQRVLEGFPKLLSPE